MTIPVARQRARRPKTRTGCCTCKAKHVKCDEDKPGCRRCAASGLTCGGYSRPSTTLTKIAVARKPACLRPRLPTPTSAAGLTRLERGALDFFCHQTAHHLLGASSPLCSDRRLVDACLGMCFQIPVVTHIAAAIGSVHISYGSMIAAHSIKDHESSAEQQGAKAVTMFRHYIATIVGAYSDTHAEIILLVSLLFYYFELWRARDRAAAVHLRSALRILYERRHDRFTADRTHYNRRLVLLDAAPGDSLSLLLQTFVRLDGDAVVSLGEPYLYPAVRESMPTAFFSLDRAMVHLDALAASVGAISDNLYRMAMIEVERMDPADIPNPSMVSCFAEALSRTLDLGSAPGLSARMKRVEHDLCQWMAALASVPFEAEQEQTRILSRIQYFSLWLEVKSWLTLDECLTDSLQEQFDYITKQCEQYNDLQQEKTSHNTAGSRCGSSTHRWPHHSLGTRLIICLCDIAFKCRDSSIRRRCVTLLASANVQGVFDTGYLTSFVQAVIDLEEKRARDFGFVQDGQDLLCHHDIPAKARLLTTDLDRTVLASTPEFYKGNRGTLVYAILGSNDEIKACTQTFRIDRKAC